MNKNRTITSECVGYGHPDKIADMISDALLDAYVEQDKNTRAGIEVMVKDNIVVLGGEVRANAQINAEEVVRNVFKNLHFSEEHHLDSNQIEVLNLIGEQSSEIARGVDKEDGEIGAGDQGFCVGYASNETESMLPLGHHIARRLCKMLVEGGFGPDCKAQVSVDYDNAGEAVVKHILVSTLHSKEYCINDLRLAVQKLMNDTKMYLAEELYNKYIDNNEHLKIDINPLGEWTVGGPVADCGLTGRKVVVDQFGGYCNVGGGAFSGKDLSKVDRSAAYLATYLARNIVNNNLADWAKITLSYVIGNPQPSAIDVELDELHKANQSKVCKWIKENIDLSPRGIIKRFDSSFKFFDTASLGHYGEDRYPWDKLDLEIEF